MVTNAAREWQSGQAMVEFCLMLIIILGLCAGMLQLSNLVNFDFWAQQDARYNAFEQVWYVDSSADVSDDSYFRRPKSVRRLDDVQDVDDEGSLSTLLALAKRPIASGTAGGTVLPEQAPVLLAKGNRTNSIWRKKTKDWYRELEEKLNFIDTAYASIRGTVVRETGGKILPQPQDPYPKTVLDTWDEHSVASGIRRALETTEFGEDFCATTATLIRRHGFANAATQFEGSDCAKTYNEEFALHIAENVDFRDLFRDRRAVFFAFAGH